MKVYRMKHIMLIFFIFSYSVLVSQDKEETLFGNSESITLGVYGGPEFKLTSFNGEVGFMTGGKGGLIINKSFTIGGGGYSIVTNHKVYDTDLDNSPWANIDFGYGGLILEYVNNPNKLVHFTGGILIGAASVSYSGGIYGFPQDVNWHRESSTFFILEPELGIDVNLIRYLRLGVDLSYRLAVGGDMTKTKASDISGLSANLSIRAYLDDISETIKKIEEQFD